MFANDLGDQGSIPGCVIPKTLKMVLDTPCLILSSIRYVSRIKWRNPGKWVASSPRNQCSSYWKGSLLVALDYGRRLYLLTVNFDKSESREQLSKHLSKLLSNNYIICPGISKEKLLFLLVTLTEDKSMHLQTHWIIFAFW